MKKSPSSHAIPGQSAGLLSLRGIRPGASIILALAAQAAFCNIATAGFIGIFRQPSTVGTYFNASDQERFAGFLPESSAPALPLDATFDNLFGSQATSTVRAGGSYSWDAGSAAVTVDPRTYLGVSGNSDGIFVNGLLHGVVDGGFETDGNLQVLQFGVFAQLTGHVAPGDSISYWVHGMAGDLDVWSNGGAITQINQPGDFSYTLSEISQPMKWQTDVSLEFEYLFSIIKGTESSDESWISFSDPGVTANVVHAVPLPSTFVVWLITFATGGIVWSNTRRKPACIAEGGDQ
ncbi:MAG TPA: hypothetical protein VGH74_12715 [Planctomycetaceae bacterium]